MRFGCCISPDQLPALTAAGGEFCEFTVARTVMGGDDAVFDRLVAQVAASPIQPLAYNVLLPGDLLVVGPEADPARQEVYLRTACRRIVRLSRAAPVVLVFGSGRSRTVPDGFPRERALDQLEAFLHLTSRIASAAGISVAIEHLRHAETNIFNTLRECGDFVRQRSLAGIGLLADIYHFMETGEPLSSIDDYGDLILHAHAADSGRRHPGTGDYPLAEFLARLYRAGYQRHCSIECSWAQFDEEIAPALAALRRADAVALAASA